MNRLIRPATQNDIPALEKIIDSTGLFPSEMLNGMMHQYLHIPDSKEFWFVSEQQGKLMGVAYCAPERLTDGTYNLYLIAIDKSFQGMGIGAELMRHVEEFLTTMGERVLLVETSSLEEFTLTRKFYSNLNYKHEATIHDFYKEGEHKIVFWKKLA